MQLNRRAYVASNVPDQSLLRDPLVWSHVYLVAAVALGFSDYDLVVFSYAAEYVVVLLISMLLFTRGWRLLLRRVLELFVKASVLAFMTLIVLALVRGGKDPHHVVYLGDLWGTMALSTGYCALTLVPALWRAYQTENPARDWVHKVVTPQISIAGVLVIAIFGGQMLSGLAGTLSAPWLRLLETALMALSAVMRVMVARWCAKDSPSDIDADYARFMDSKTLG